MNIRLLNMRLLTFLALTTALVGCDIIEAPYYENPVNQLPADEQCIELSKATEPFTEPITRKVLVEEMTGHKCGNCPEMGEFLHDMKVNTYPDQMIVVAIHAGALSTPNSTGKYTTDFRTSAGNEYYTELNPFDVVPFVTIERRDKVVGTNAVSSFQTKIGQAVQRAPEAGIRVFNCYEADSMALTTVIDMKYLTAGGENDYLAVCLIEDKIQDWQTDYRTNDHDLENYTHHDVFRSPINGVWGEPVSDGSTISADTRLSKTYTFQLREGWNPANCKVVAYIYDFDTKEVKQAEEAVVVN